MTVLFLFYWFVDRCFEFGISAVLFLFFFKTEEIILGREDGAREDLLIGSD